MMVTVGGPLLFLLAMGEAVARPAKAVRKVRMAILDVRDQEV